MSGLLVELHEKPLIKGELGNLKTENYKDTEKERLVNKARKGDQEAFNELVRLHRAKAHGWAYSVTKDTFLAEDIVQEALFRAFIKLGTLLDTKKFTPWLKQIVRNEAYMKIRTLNYKMNRSLELHQPSRQNDSQVDWGNIDQVLSFLSVSAIEKSKEANPEDYLMRLSVVEGICTLLKCLTKREKAFFEAYFFDDLPPHKIADLFQTTKANVYNTISRSKIKVQKERIRICIQGYVQKNAVDGAPKKKILLKPEI